MTTPRSKKKKDGSDNRETLSDYIDKINTVKTEPGCIPYLHVERTQDPKDYVQIKGKDIVPGLRYYRISDDGKRFDLCIAPSIEEKELDSTNYIYWVYYTKILSKAGRLYQKR